MDKKIKVIQIIDDYKVVINIGSSSGVKENHRYLVYSLSSDEIFDPDTKESLGYLELVRGTGKIIHVQEKISTLESDEFQSSTRKIVHKSALTSMLGETVEEIEIDKHHIPFEEPQVGDFVKRIN